MSENIAGWNSISDRINTHQKVPPFSCLRYISRALSCRVVQVGSFQLKAADEQQQPH